MSTATDPTVRLGSTLPRVTRAVAFLKFPKDGMGNWGLRGVNNSADGGSGGRLAEE
jgi:hypothetical protein